MNDLMPQNMKRITTLFETGYQYYSAIKLVYIKNELIGRKAILNTNKGYISDQFRQFKLIGEKILNDFVDENRRVEKLKSQRNPLIPGTTKGSIVAFIAQEVRKGKTISDLSSAARIVVNAMKRNKALSLRKPISSQASSNKSIAFKVLKSDYTGRIVKLL